MKEPKKRTQTTPPPPSKKEEFRFWNLNNILTIVFLCLFPIVGFILLWLASTFSKKAKITITAAYIAIFVFCIVWFYFVVAPLHKMLGV